MIMIEKDWRVCLAPMMDWTDTHCRYFWRLLTRNARLYTEMVTTGAIIHGDRDRFLRFHPTEHPLALQLGGSDPLALAECARIAESYGYDEVNLNCGCPSDRVQNGKIGACLMAEPELVAECIAAMVAAVRIPVTVKHRLGIDELDSDEHLHQFVGTVAAAGCRVFIVHARKAWLKGLSPRQNRDVPPLQYERVRLLKQTFPHLTVVVNGGIASLSQCADHLQSMDGVMIGREAYQNPYMLADIDAELFGDDKSQPERDWVLREFMQYCDAEVLSGKKISAMTRHVMGLYAGQTGGRIFRRYLSENATRAGAKADVLMQARRAMTDSCRRTPDTNSSEGLLH